MNKKEIIKEHLKLLPQKQLLKINRNLTEWYGEYYSYDSYVDMEALENVTYDQVLNILDEMVDLIITEYQKGGEDRENLIYNIDYYSDLVMLIDIVLGGKDNVSAN